jgi:hypothetical protein
MEIRKFISRLRGKNKLDVAGIIICLLSIFTVDPSVAVFSVLYLLGAVLIFISTIMDIKKFNKKSVEKVISGIAVLMLMLGVFAVIGFSRNFYYVQLAGIFLMLIETLSGRGSKDETGRNTGIK